MKKTEKIILNCLILFFSSSYSSLVAQPGDDLTGRLWRLAKVYGFAKYFHPNNCVTDWNTMLVSAIDSTLLTTSNDEANQILSDFLNQAGFVPHSTEPLTINAEMNVNADFSWMDNPYFDAAVSASLDSILINFRPHDNCMYADPNYPEYLSFASDPLTISGFSYLKESHRLITFFYYWNMISYFHPTRFLMDQSWDTTLLKFIPLIRSATDDLAFHKTFLQLVAHINDTHGFTGSTFLSDFLAIITPN